MAYIFRVVLQYICTKFYNPVSPMRHQQTHIRTNTLQYYNTNIGDIKHIYAVLKNPLNYIL